MFNNDTLSAVFTAIVSSFAVFYFIRNYVRNKRLPKGPWGLPVIGYTPFLTLKPHLKLTHLANVYGPVFSVKLGSSDVVFLNDWESVKDAFSRDELLGRPENFFTNGINVNESNMANSSGNFWKEHRRLALRIFRDLGFGKQTMETNLKDEINNLSQHIDKNIDEPINVHELLVCSVANNIIHFLFGHSFDFKSPMGKKLEVLLQNFPQFFQFPLMISFMPMMVKILKLPFIKEFALKSFVRKLNELESLIDDEISQHEKKLDENDIQDYFDGYLVERKTRKLDKDNGLLSNSVLNSNAVAFIGAGSETVRTTLDWILKRIAFDSKLQKAVQMEIDNVVGRDRLPSWSDREFMPLIQAVILETERWASIVAINLPRRAMSDTKILDHSIPKDTIVFANFWAINRDPKLWENADEFNPYRFISKDGKLQTFEYLTPFSYGKRACVGETLAKIEVFLYFAILMQKYEITVPQGVDPSFDMYLTLTMQPTQVPILRFKKR